MALSAYRPFDIINQTLTVGLGERLGFNATQNSFVIVRKGFKTSEECSTSLSIVSRKIQELISQKNFQPEQILNLKLNINTINTLYLRYNAAIARCCLFNILDKFILIVTLGLVRLKYSAMETPQIDEKANDLLKSDLDEQMTCRLIHYFAADLQRIPKLPTLVSMVLMTSQSLSQDDMSQLVVIASEYAKFLKYNPNQITITPQKVYEKLFHLVNQPAYAPQLQSIVYLVEKELARFNFQPEFRFMSNSGKEMMINLAEIVRKKSPGRMSEVFTTPASLLHAIDHISQSGNKVGLLQDVLNHAFTKMESFCPLQMQRFVDLVHTLIKKYPVLTIDLKGLSSRQRLPLLAFLAKDPAIRTSPLSVAVCSACLSHSDTLGSDEKPHFFVLQHSLDPTFKSIATSKKLLIDLVKGVSLDGNAHQFDVKAINSYVDYTQLNDDEANTYIRFLGDFNFILALTHAQVVHHISYLTRNNSRIGGLTNAAFQLCSQYRATCPQHSQAIELTINDIYEHLDINLLTQKHLQELVNQPWFQQDPAKQLKKVDFSKITDGKFKILSSLPAFGLKADIYLANASDAHLTMYYGPDEQSLTVNNTHLFKYCTLQEKEIPPLPKGVQPPALDQLLTMFNQINFTDKSKKDYYDSPLLDEKKPVTPDHVRDGLMKLIQYITNGKFYSSAPKEKLSCGNANPSFNKFFENMLLCAQHIILSLNKKSPSERAAVLVILGIGGHRCAMRHQEDTRQMYSYLTGETLDIDLNATAIEILYSVLVRFRLQILLELAQITNNDVHFVNATRRHVGPKLGITEESGPGSDDVHEPYEWHPVNRPKTIYQFLINFNKKYQSTEILNAINRFVNDPQRTKQLDFRAKFMDAISCKLKANGPTLGDLIIHGIPDYPGFRITRQGLRVLLKAYDILQDVNQAKGAATLPTAQVKAVPAAMPAQQNWSLKTFVRRLVGWDSN